LIRSMTAFGSAAFQQGGDRRYVAEIRSVNHRYRDIVLRLPRNHQPLEEGLRNVISSRTSRGRIEASFQIEMSCEAPPYELELNLPLAESYLRVFKQLADHSGLDQEMRLESLLQMKDVMLIKPETDDMEEAREGLHAALNRALDALEEMRIKEGEAIVKDFDKRLERLEAYVDAVYRRAPELPEVYQKRLTERVGNLLNGVEVDPPRLAQEVAFLADRSDITEEIVRARSHLKQFRDYLLSDDAVGRRLDFLLQEINREVNTLGVKASDTAISQIAVEMKAELEKLREQVQNVE
jgi:uncharacterized protein (TIGR00255 family)